jgi:hypothetical protein
MFGKERKYYREYLGCCGWGVMVMYDSVWATSSGAAMKMPQKNAYLKGDFEGIYKIKKEHINLTDDELAGLYGIRDNEN